MTKLKLTYIWHMYHNRLVTSLFYTAPIKKRRISIKAHKPPGEHALRLRLLKIVKGKIPDEITKKVWSSFNAGQRYDLTYEKAIIKLHKKECKNCPWDGVTIFPIQED